MNTNTNLSFLQSHSFPFFNREISNKDIHSDSIAGSSLRKSEFYSSASRNNLKQKYIQKERIEQTRQCCKRFFTFLFSHIGLSALLVGYVIIGGVMFQKMEVSNEKLTKELIIDNRTKFINEIIRKIDSRHRLLSKTTLNCSNVMKYTNESFSLENYLTSMVVNYTKEIMRAIQDDGWNGSDDSENLNWSYAGSLLYVLTVITTIGYGHVAPKTIAGKILTMLYALIGIPLTFLYLSNVGDYLADWFRFIYHKVCRKYCSACCQRSYKQHSEFRKRLRKTNAFPGLTNQIAKRERQKQNCKSNNIKDKSFKQLKNKLVPFPLKSKDSDEDNNSRVPKEISDSQSILNSQHDPYVFKSYGIARFLPSVKTVKQREALMMNCVSTHVPLINWKDIDKDLEIGSLDNIPTVFENSDANAFSNSELDINQDSLQNQTSMEMSQLLVSPSFPSTVPFQLYKSLPYLSNLTDVPIKNSLLSKKSISYTPDINFVTESVRQVSYVSVNNIEEIDTEKKGSNPKTVKLRTATVPISLSLTIIWIYIIFGSIIFTLWGDKDFVKWAYFCFITLSTIGFGDIVPGTKVDSNNPKEKLILVSVYVIIGLSVFAMCFKLMQEEVVAKFKRLGRKIGIWKNRFRLNKSHDRSSELRSLKRV